MKELNSVLFALKFAQYFPLPKVPFFSFMPDEILTHTVKSNTNATSFGKYSQFSRRCLLRAPLCCLPDNIDEPLLRHHYSDSNEDSVSS